jgi:putative ABC transport system permease protein
VVSVGIPDRVPFTGEGGDSPIVGIVGDVRGVSLENRPRPTVYLPYWHAFVGQASIIVRTAAEPNAIVPPLRAAIRQLDGDMAAPAFASMEQMIARSVLNPPVPDEPGARVRDNRAS